jgi:tetratricopeptide (TPR) repeat protein
MLGQTPPSQQDEENLPSRASFPPEEVEAELQRILSSPTFSKAPRHCRFLTFVVHKALAGEGESVKEYLIGLEVFDRPSDYDPGIDPVVRAEARRLRSRLADYYKKIGRHDPIQIDLPKGTYVPVFQRNSGNANVLPGGEVVQGQTVSRKVRWVPWVLAAALFGAGAGYGFHLLRGRGRPPAPPANPQANVLVLAEFTNTTGEALFDGALRQGLASQLEQSPFLNLLSDERIAQTLSLMGQPREARLTRELAYEVCQRTASSAAIEGSISSLGAQYALDLTAVRCSDGKTLAEEKITAEGKEQVLKALGEATTNLRQKLGESLASIQKYDVPPERVTTASLEALQAYSLGYQAMLRNDYSAATSQFQRAISLDPNFAMAYARLGTIYQNESQTVQAAENTRKAYELRDRVSDREKFYIDAHYYNLVTNNLEAAGKTYELWAQTYPQDSTVFGNIGVTYAVLGNYDKSLAGYQQDLKLNPESAVTYANLIYGYLSVNRVDDARALAQQAQTTGIGSPLMHAYLYYVDFVRHDLV